MCDIEGSGDASDVLVTGDGTAMVGVDQANRAIVSFFGVEIPDDATCSETIAMDNAFTRNVYYRQFHLTIGATDKTSGMIVTMEIRIFDVEVLDDGRCLVIFGADRSEQSDIFTVRCFQIQS